MNFFKRAIRYCRRQRLRSALLFSVFTLLLSGALVTLSAGQATAEGTGEVKKTVGASIHIEIDTSNQNNYGAGTENGNGITYQYNGDYITQEVIDAIEKVEGVVNYSAESEGGYWGAAVDFAYFSGSFNIDYTGGYGQSVPYTVTLNSELSANFLNGTYTLEEGHHITPEDSYAVLISKELADKNGLAVGDSIAMYDLDSSSENTFEIVGIFSGTEGLSKDAMMSDEIPANQGYMDMNSYNEIFQRTSLELGSLDVYVDSAEHVQDILQTIQKLPEMEGRTFTYSTDTENFDLISDPLSSLQTMTETAVVVIAVIGAALVTLLLILWTRGRKRETGILMAVGRSKKEIILQFLTENFLIGIPAAAFSWGLASLLCEKAGTFFLKWITDDVSALHLVIHPADLAVVYGMGTLLLILAVVLSSIMIIRLKPREILSQMD